MKRISTMVFLVVILTTRTFAQQSPGFSISANGGCVSATTSVVLKAQFPEGLDTTGAHIVWKYLIHDGVPTTNIWIPIPDSNRTELVVLNFPAIESREYVFVVTIHGITYRSNQVTLCYCRTTDINSLIFTTGGVSPDNGRAVLRYKPSGYMHIYLEVSIDNGYTYSTIKEITGTTYYISSEKIIGIVLYRLRGITEAGMVEYGKIFKVAERPKKGIEYWRPVMAMVVNSAGQVVKTYTNISAPNGALLFSKAILGLPISVYTVWCYQGDIAEPLKGIE